MGHLQVSQLQLEASQSDSVRFDLREKLKLQGASCKGCRATIGRETQDQRPRQKERRQEKGEG